MSEEKFTVFVTKFALTMGVLELPVRQASPSTVVCHEPGQYSHFRGEGKEWHRTREGAVKKAIEMRRNKILSLRRQIEKLEERQFT